MAQPSTQPLPSPLAQQPVYKMDTASTNRPSSFPRQFTILMDTDHSDITMLRAFRDTLRNFIAAGGKHLIVEQESVYQEIFEHVKSKRANLNDFADVLHESSYLPERHRAEAQAIAREVMQMALDRNLEYTATDFAPRTVREFPDIHQHIVRLNSLPKTEADKEFGRLMSDKKFRERYEEFKKMFDADRVASDQHLIAEINKKVKPGDKALVFYGKDHGYRLAEGLGFERSQGVVLVNSETEMGRDLIRQMKDVPTLPPQDSTKPPATPRKPAAVKSGTEAPAQEAHATPTAAKPGISPTLANHLKGGALGAVGVGAAIASGAPKTVEEGLKLGAEAILPGSTTAGNDVCKITGTVVGGVAGTAAAMGAGALAFGGTVVPTTPVGATVISVGAGAAAFTATQPVAKLGTEALCNAVLPDGVKNAANKALATLNSALTFGGSEKVAQNSHKQQVATGSQGKQ